MEGRSREGSVVHLMATTARDSPDQLDQLEESADQYVSRMMMQPDDNLDLFSTQRLFAKHPNKWDDVLYVPTNSERCNACTPCLEKACKSRENQDIICLNCLEKKACVIKAHQGCVLWHEHMSKNYFSTMKIANNALKAKYESMYKLVHESSLDAFFACKKSPESTSPPSYEESAVGGEIAKKAAHAGNEWLEGGAANVGTTPKQSGAEQSSAPEIAMCDNTCGQACDVICFELCGDVCANNCDVARFLIHKHKVCDGSCKGQCADTCKLLCGQQCVDVCVTACENQHKTQSTHKVSSPTQHSDSTNKKLDQLMGLIKTQQNTVAAQMDGLQRQVTTQMSSLQTQVTAQIGSLENRMTTQIDDIQNQLSYHKQSMVELDKRIRTNQRVRFESGLKGGVNQGGARPWQVHDNMRSASTVDAPVMGHTLHDRGPEGEGIDQIGRLAAVLEKGLLQNQKATARLPQISLPQMTKMSNNIISGAAYFSWERKVLKLMTENNLADSMVTSLIQNDQSIPRRFRLAVQNCSETRSIFSIFASMCEPLECILPKLINNLTSLPACHDTESQISGLDKILVSIAEIENFFEDKDLTVTELTATFAALCSSEQLSTLPAQMSTFKERHQREGTKYITLLKEYSLRRRADLYNIKSALEIYRPGDQTPHNTLIPAGTGGGGRGGGVG